MGFNTINFIINTTGMLYLNGSNMGNVNRNIQPQAQNQPLNNTPLMQSASLASSLSTFYEAKNLSPLKQNMISTVEVEQQANYVKDLLNLPRDFQTLIDEIQGNNKGLQSLKELSKLLQNGKISLSGLSMLLSNNSKEAAQKLMNTIMAVSKMGSSDLSQLKHLMGMFTSASANIESTQMVKNLIMLYLPWLPLSVRNDLKLDFEIGINEKNNEGGEGLETITIMIQTANFGNILAVLEASFDNDINISISAGEDFPEKKVMEKFKNENKTNNIKAKIDVQKTTSISKNLKKEEQNFKITTSDFVSPKLLLAAHSLIKIIIELDSLEFIINEEEEN